MDDISILEKNSPSGSWLKKDVKIEKRMPSSVNKRGAFSL